MSRPIIYRNGNWFPMLNHIGELLTTLTAPELRLYLALCVRGRGRARTVSFTNKDLQRLAGLNRNSLPKARDGLVTGGWIQATSAGKESYDYTILEPRDEVVSAPEIAAPPKAIPRDILFRSLESSETQLRADP